MAALYNDYALARFAVALALTLLAGCSCCNTLGQTRTYVIDDATAMRSGPFGCVDVCNALGFGAVDGHVPDAGSRPVAPASRCSLDHGTTAWTLTCYFGRGCPS